MDLTATEAARRFSEILDAVERRGESFVIVRKGRPAPRMGPAAKASGGSIKEKGDGRGICKRGAATTSADSGIQRYQRAERELWDH